MQCSSDENMRVGGCRGDIRALFAYRPHRFRMNYMAPARSTLQTAAECIGTSGQPEGSPAPCSLQILHALLGAILRYVQEISDPDRCRPVNCLKCEGIGP
jgi:hypothetical protein